MISFLLLTLGFSYLLFLVACFRCKVRLFILFFLLSWGKFDHPLSTAFTESHRFGVVVFSFSFISMHIFISFLISSVIWLFRSVLFSLHMFVFLVVFFLFSSVQSLSRVRLFATPWIAAHQASLSITNSRSSLKPTSIESVMHLAISPFVVPFPPAPNPSQHQSLFQWVNSSHEVAKVLELQL